MSDSEARLEELQRRLTAALDRVARVAEELAPPAPAAPDIDPEEVAALKQALDEERQANAQLEERVKALRERQAGAAAEAEKALADQRAAMAQLDQDLQRVRQANEQLRENNRALREANEEGVGEPHLINKSMLTELEALRASRAADRSEAEAIVSALTPLVVEGARASEGGS